jgi:tripartite-type tricarboxylate transporter receptor subunit TctC
VPTLEEQGVRDTEVYAWQGMAVPAATPRDVTAKLSNELNRAISTPEVTRKLQEFGLEPIPGTSDQMAAYIKSETARWHALIKQRNLTLD